LLDWDVGQSFQMVVDTAVDTAVVRAADTAAEFVSDSAKNSVSDDRIVLSGHVMSCTADGIFVSNGGLLLYLPKVALPNATRGSPVCTSLEPMRAARKRTRPTSAS
jgi:hypothetical protein